MITITRIHPVVPFKRKEDIIRHISKAVSYGYCKYQYDVKNRNCEHLVNRCIFGINISQQIYDGRRFNLEDEIKREGNKIDELTPSYSYEKQKIEKYMQEAENNRSYTRSKYEIEKEKFQERVEVYPKDWCRIQ